MALPIRETPILTGKDARTFKEKCDNAHKNPVSIQMWKRARKVYDTMKRKNKLIEF